MSESNPRSVFINLAVTDLKRAMTFFQALGFEFNPQFTDDKAACMIINETAYVMLLQRSYFKTFTRREPCDTTAYTETMLAVSCSSRQGVDDMYERALAAGGKQAMDTVDHGFMYNRSFYDVDGHHWEVLWMDMSAVPNS